jgi:hypothetical protein
MWPLMAGSCEAQTRAVRIKARPIESDWFLFLTVKIKTGQRFAT